jgi:cell division protein FtsQ
MNTGRVIRKILFVTMWLVIGAGMLTLLIAAIGKQKKDHCKDYSITIKGVEHNFFVDEQDIASMLKASVGGNIQGQPRSSFNLRKMEASLESNVWIRNAELYFDNRDVLHVSITEREPIARIFTMTGKSYYIDEDEKKMPLSDKLSAKVPVFTGFPEKVLSRRDSLLLHTVRSVAATVIRDPFWLAQVAQINITEERNFEMIPVVGNHLVLLGDGENMDRKFHRLFVFYKNIMSRTGFDAYRTINVQYAGQVIGIKDRMGKNDTTELRLNVEKLLRQARELQNDSIIAVRSIREQRSIVPDPALAATENNITGAIGTGSDPQSHTNPILVTNPVTMKPFSNPLPSEKPINPKPVKREGAPKAVMPKRN